MRNLKVQNRILSAVIALSIFCVGCTSIPDTTDPTATVIPSYETEESSTKTVPVTPTEDTRTQDTQNDHASTGPISETQVPAETGTEPIATTVPVEPTTGPTVPSTTESISVIPETTAPPATQSTEPTVSETTAPPETPPSTEVETKAPTEAPTEKEVIDLSALSQYGINYAVSTYGYEYWPGMRDGWYPPFTAYIPDMESGYEVIRGCVDTNTKTLEARGEHIVEYVDGVAYGMPIDIVITPDPDGFEDSYLIYIYY